MGQGLKASDLVSDWADLNLPQEDAKPVRALRYSAAKRLKGRAPALILVTNAAHE